MWTTYGARAPSPVTNPLLNAAPVPKAGAFPPLGAHGRFQAAPAALSTSIGAWMTTSPVPHPGPSIGPMGLGAPNNTAVVKRPRSPLTNSTAIDYQTAGFEHVMKRQRPFGPSEEVNNLPVNIQPAAYNSQTLGQSSDSPIDLPKNFVTNLNQGSSVKSLDFHPLKQNLLLVGTNMGDVMVWDLVTRERIAFRNSKVWELGTCSMHVQGSFQSDYSASINRVMWSPDGSLSDCR